MNDIQNYLAVRIHGRGQECHRINENNELQQEKIRVSADRDVTQGSGQLAVFPEVQNLVSLACLKRYEGERLPASRDRAPPSFHRGWTNQRTLTTIDQRLRLSYALKQFQRFGLATMREGLTGCKATPISSRLNARRCSASVLCFVVLGLICAFRGVADPAFVDQDWETMGGLSGCNGYPRAMAADPEGNVYIGGDFTAVGDVVTSSIAKWDGHKWSALGSLFNYGVYALAVSGTNLYAGGSVSNPGGIPFNYVAKWNGSTWEILGSVGGYGKNTVVWALAVSGTDVYAGGLFTTVDDVPVNNIAKWDGSKWSALGSGTSATPFVNQNDPSGPAVTALAVSGSVLYAGGHFTVAGTNAANFVAKWDGTDWSALDVGVDAPVNALAVSGSDLYVGGRISLAGANRAVGIAKWDGTMWSALGSGVSSFLFPSVYSLAALGTNLYAGGTFTTAGGVPANYIAQWNGSNWEALGSGAAAYVTALAVSGSNLYAGIDTGLDLSAAENVRLWDGSRWSTVGSGPNNAISDQPEALLVSGSDLYAGGYFQDAGSITVNHVAKWSGGSWSALGSGMDDSVEALAISGTNLYAGGGFTTAGGFPANHIAKWNGSAWESLGSGMNNWVEALAVVGTDLYAGGSFTTAGGITVNHIAKWDGSTWTALGSGLTGGVRGNTYTTVNALAVSGHDLYAGGMFATAGGVQASCIAKWNGSSWSALQYGVDYTVRALAVSGPNLYVGGDLTVAGGITTHANANLPVGIEANGIAMWNGNSWSALGSGVFVKFGPGFVYAIAASASDVYAGGDFITAGGVPANYIAKWNGASWEPLGSGMGAHVQSLAVSDTDLFAGGFFTILGGTVSAYVGRAPLPSAGAVALSTHRFGPSSLTLSWPSAAGAGFVLEQAAALRPATSWSPVAANLTSDGANTLAAIPVTNNAQFFRLHKP